VKIYPVAKMHTLVCCRMSSSSKCLLAVFALLALSADPSACSKASRSRTKSSEERRLSPNICDMPSDALLYCYCDVNDPGTALEASCWVFNELRKEDTVWATFTTQSELTRLKLMVRPNGNMNFVPTAALAHLPKVRTIDVQYASIPSIPPHAFANRTNLEELFLTR
jgi:hypothetical protein